MKSHKEMNPKKKKKKKTERYTAHREKTERELTKPVAAGEDLLTHLVA